MWRLTETARWKRRVPRARSPIYAQDSDNMNEDHRILVASDSGISIRSFGDISDAIAACIEAEGLILTEGDLAEEFFDLRSGLAGELSRSVLTITCGWRLFCQTLRLMANESASLLTSISHTA